MKGCSIGEFMDDLLSVGGPEKEFIFRNRFYFLETLYREKKNLEELYLDEYDNSDPKSKVYLQTHSFSEKILLNVRSNSRRQKSLMD